MGWFSHLYYWICDMVQVLGNALLNNSGFICMILVAVTVAIAIFGTTLSCMNTGVRVTYAMAKDEEMPTVMSALHIKHATPHTAVLFITVVSAVIGAFTVVNVTTMTAVTLISNIGTFLLYGMTNIVALVAFSKQKKRNILTAVLVPVLGAVANIGMLIAVIALGIVSGGATMIPALIATGVTVVWLFIGVVFCALASGAEFGHHKLTAFYSNSNNEPDSN